MRMRWMAGILFYWHNCRFRGQSAFSLFLALFFGCFLFVYGFYFGVAKQEALLAWLMPAGLVFSAGVAVYAFVPSWRMHRSLLRDSAYTSLHDYYLKMGTGLS